MDNEEQKFQAIVEEITKDLSDAAERSFLYRKLIELIPNYDKEFNRYTTFWSIVLNSLLESSILALARAYDQNNIGLRKLIKFSEENKGIFEAQKFKKRLQNKNHPYAETCSQNFKIPQEKDFQQYLDQVHSNKELVKKLIQVRSNFIAHKNEGQLFRNKKPIQPLSWEEFDELIDRGCEIRNFFTISYDNSTYGGIDNLIAKEDYKILFSHLKVATIALDFINFDVRQLNSENYQSIATSFLDKIRNEIYKRNV
jgi:hypothetical protein